jgi:hypothetical protein
MKDAPAPRRISKIQNEDAFLPQHDGNAEAERQGSEAGVKCNECSHGMLSMSTYRGEDM